MKQIGLTDEAHQILRITKAEQGLRSYSALILKTFKK